MRGWMLSLTAAVMIVAAPALAADWIPIRDTEARVSIDMPGEYQTESKENQTDLGPVPVVNRSVTKPNGYYIFSVANFGENLRAAAPSPVLESFVDGAIEGMGATKLSQQKITVSGAEGRDVAYRLVVEGIAVNGRMRVIFRGGRLYSAQALSFGQGDDAMGDRFLASLRLLD